MRETSEKPFNTKAAAWTVGVHIALLILFMLFTYSTPAFDTPVQELGMEVNLGTSEDGSGTDQPMATEDPAPDAASTAYKANAADNSEAKDMLRSEDADAPAVNAIATANRNNNNRPETQNRRNRTQQQATNNNTTSRPQSPRYVYGGATGRGGNSAATNSPGTSEGNTTGSGDRGVPGGTPGASNYTGTPGNGNGISHTLNRRSIVAFPPPEADFREGGKVVIRITVNRSGEIINKQIVSSSNAELRSIALRKVDKIRFNKSTEAPEEQFGNITFVFKTRS